MKGRTFMNPFYVGREFKKDAFIDREEETKEVLKIIKSSNNVVLYAPRRFGKTWFAKNLEEVLKAEKINSMWIDMFSTVTIKQFIARFNQEASSTLKMNLLDYIKKYLSDHISSFSINIAGTNLEFKPSSEEEIWEVLFKTFTVIQSKSNKKIVIFIDEVQEMIKMGEKFEGILRTAIQHQSDVNYVFLGSRKSIVEEIFFQKTHPLFKSAIKYDLSKYLPEVETRNFIIKSFEKTNKKISPSAVDSIVTFSKLHPFYVQLISSQVWDYKDKIESKDVEWCVSNLISQNEYFFQNLIENINSKYALPILKMISSGEFSYSADNLIKWEIRSPASIAKVIKNLEEKEIIIKVNGKYFIEDPLFEEFIKKI